MNHVVTAVPATCEEFTQDQLWELFQDQIRVRPVVVVFLKKDGSERTMNCSLQKEAYDSYDFKTSEEADEAPAPKAAQPVWDITANGWRSIKKGTIVSVT